MGCAGRIVDDPKFIESVLGFFDGLKIMLDDEHPDHVRIGAQPVASGQEAAKFADAIYAVSFSIDEGLNDNTKALAASSCDYVQDLMDLDDVPMSSRLGFAKEPDGILQDLRMAPASFQRRVTASSAMTVGVMRRLSR